MNVCIGAGALFCTEGGGHLWPYPRGHCEAARQFALEHFAAATVATRVLEDAT